MPDLGNYTLILEETFDQDLNVYDGTTGVWSQDLPRDALMTNGPMSVFLDGAEITAQGDAIGADPFTVDNGVLEIGAGVFTEGQRADVDQLLIDHGEDNSVGDVRYYTGQINTYDTWGQTYGYFEIVAKVPVGKGHWPAFWLTDAGEGWPPEIDIFEAYGKRLDKPARVDNSFHAAVHFDTTDADGNDTQSIDIDNPYVLDEDGNPTPAQIRTVYGKETARFGTTIDADDYGFDIYENFYTYSVEWTPTEIIYYFGIDRDNLIEIFRAPTPDDLHSPMALIANDQISSTFGWNPVDGYDHLTFAEDNTFQIDSISIYALNPETEIAGAGDGAIIVGGADASTIEGTTGNDRINPGEGLDFIALGGGSDVVFVTRGTGNDVIEGFGADDTVVIEGFAFDGAAGALERLTQVGNDVWLSNGAYPKNPQTIIFRDAIVEDFTADNFLVRWSDTPDIWTSRLIDGDRLRDLDADGLVTAAPEGSVMADVSDYRGAMTLVGSGEGDLYYIYRNGSVIVEAEDGGVDTVHTTRSHTLSDNVENIVANGGGGAIVLTGNDLANKLVAGGRDTTLVGEGGDDFHDLTGGLADTVRYGAGDGHDVVVGFGADDTLELDGLVFASEADFAAHVLKTAAGVVVDLGAGQSVTFRDAARDTVLAGSIYEIGVSNVGPVAGDNLFAKPIVGSEADMPTMADLIGSGPADAVGTDDGETLHARGGEYVDGSAGDDRLIGCDDADTLVGGEGNDTLRGKGGEDILFGGAGKDYLFGFDHDDTLSGGEGSDVLTGDAGMDVFVFTADDTTGRDLVKDYEVGETLMIEGDRGLESVVQRGTGANIKLDDGFLIVLRDFDAAQFQTDDIVFI